MSSLDERARYLEAWQDVLLAKERAVQAREIAVQAREQTVSSREAAVQLRESAASSPPPGGSPARLRPRPRGAGAAAAAPRGAAAGRAARPERRDSVEEDLDFDKFASSDEDDDGGQILLPRPSSDEPLDLRDFARFASDDSDFEDEKHSPPAPKVFRSLVGHLENGTPLTPERPASRPAPGKFDSPALTEDDEEAAGTFNVRLGRRGGRAPTVDLRHVTP
ncbi:hypothetical protein SO694_00027263 [Aureococcus anophagefferens]|uniref:Uncharacterized protein n=1 Tax=Aureococcus anophagefferens TaxID=44056 RepID=A0ABR1FUU9_AURAN